MDRTRLGFDKRAEPRHPQVQMTAAQARVLSGRTLPLAAACALILFVVISILPR